MALLRGQAKAAIAYIRVRHAAPDHAVEYVKKLHSELGVYAISKKELLDEGDVLVVGRWQPQAFQHTGCIAGDPRSRI